MTQHLTPDLIAESLVEYDGIWASDDDATFVVDKHLGGGEVRVTLWRWDEDKAHDVEVDARTFRIVEVES